MARVPSEHPEEILKLSSMVSADQIITGVVDRLLDVGGK